MLSKPLPPRRRPKTALHYVGSDINPNPYRYPLCYAPTRSGNLSWTESAVITDLKGELYELTAGWRQEHAHNQSPPF